MFRKSKKKLLFVNPDYHNCFLLKDELKKLGWKVDVYKPRVYPELLLYSDDYITDRFIKSTRWPKYLNIFFRLFFFFFVIPRYHYYIVYGEAHVCELLPGSLRYRFFKRGLPFELALLKLLGKKIVYFPSGCLEEALKSDFQKHYPNLCANCGWAASFCQDKRNQISFDLRNQYGDFTIANTPMPTLRTKKEMVKFRCLDLGLWHPELKIPESFRLPSTPNLRIMHSFFDANRLHNNKNIKGSPYVVKAIEQLKSEGYPIEYFFVNSVSIKHMRFYQVQADIIVDQLIYGWWGSTSIEAMALGKPVVCYLHPEWKRFFLEKYPEYQELPIVEANTQNIYHVLKELLDNAEYREQRGKASRVFAEQHFDVKKNVYEIEKLLLNI